MQSVKDIVDTIFSKPPKPPMSYDVTLDPNSLGNTNLFHLLMSILIEGAKKLYGNDIIPANITKDMFAVLQQYINSIGYTIKYIYKYADDNITPVSVDIWFEKYMFPINCHGIRLTN